MKLRLTLNRIVAALAIVPSVLLFSSCGEVSLNDPLLQNPDLSHTIFYVKYLTDPKTLDQVSQVMRINADGSNKMVIAERARISTAPRNGKIIYMADIPGCKDSVAIMLCDIDGSNKYLIDIGLYVNTRLSPDASFAIATTKEWSGSSGPKEDAKIIRFDLRDPSNPVADSFTHKKLDLAVYPALSPDGKRLAYATESFGGKSDLYVLELSNKRSNWTCAVNISYGERLSWSEDSRYVIAHIGISRQIVDADNPTAKPKQIFTPSGWKISDIVFTSEPNKILFVAAPPLAKAYNIYEANVDSALTPDSITFDPTIYGKIGGYSSDNRYFAYSSVDINAPQFTYYARQLKVIDMETKEDRMIEIGVYECFFTK